MRLIEHLDGKKIILTGSTGFVGRITLSKLLRCTNIKKVYLPIRGDAEKRLNKILSDKNLFVDADKERLVPLSIHSSIRESLQGIPPEMIDGVLHLAAKTDWRLNLSDVLEDNVVEAEKMSDFWDRNFVLCSTIFIKPLIDGVSLPEDTINLEAIYHYFSAYAASKAICEKRLIANSNNISIVRIGGVAGNMDRRDAPLGWSIGSSAYNGLFILNEIAKANPPMIFPIAPDKKANTVPVNIAANSLIAALAERIGGVSGNKFYNVIPLPEFNFNFKEIVECIDKDGLILDNPQSIGNLFKGFMHEDLDTLKKASKLHEHLLTLGKCVCCDFDDIEFGNLMDLQEKTGNDRFPMVYTGTVADLINSSHNYFLNHLYMQKPKINHKAA